MRSVRMAHLAIVGSHSTNGVSELHSELLRTQLMPDFAAIFPERFNNKTNGVTPRRWLLVANPRAGDAHHRRPSATAGSPISNSCGSLAPLAQDAGLSRVVPGGEAPGQGALRGLAGRDDGRLRRSRHAVRLPHQAHSTSTSGSSSTCCTSSCSPSASRANPALPMPRRTFFFAGKAAPAYHGRQADHQAHQQRGGPHRRPIRRCATGSRSCFCPTTASAWPSA